MTDAYKIVDGLKYWIGIDDDAIRETRKWVPPPGTRFLVTYPKSGTTWSQMIVHLLCNDGREPASNVMRHLSEREIPMLEMTGLEGVVDRDDPPLAYKLHLPFWCAPWSPDAKYLYVVRNPKDVVVSFYHMYLGHNLTRPSSFDAFFAKFMDGELAPGAWWDHAVGWALAASRPNITILTYESMKRDRREAVRRMAAFMGDEFVKKLDGDTELMDRILKYSSVEFMKKMDDPFEHLRDENELKNRQLPKGIVSMFDTITRAVQAAKDNGLEVNDRKSEFLISN